MQVVLFDDASRNQLLPFTHTRPVADIRCGILTMRERWEKLLQQKSYTLTAKYLQHAFHFPESDEEYLYINGSIFGAKSLSNSVVSLGLDEALVCNDLLIAFKTKSHISSAENFENITSGFHLLNFSDEVKSLKNIWDIFSFNEKYIISDFELLTNGRNSAALPDFVTAVHPENIFIEEGAKLSPCILNADSGKIYIGKNAELMDGCMLRGSIAIGENATVKMGAKIYGGTTIGPGCKVGGEISNVVFFANSNKGHDGFLGNAVIGEWCNLGADTNCSNLKNNYDEIKIWNEYENKSVKTGLQFCGLMMGDHSKCGINTMFNTGTVVGVSCNIYGGGFLNKFIPSFSWGDNQEMTSYKIEKAIETANRMMNRRGKTLSEAETEVLNYIFKTTSKQRDLLS